MRNRQTERTRIHWKNIQVKGSGRHQTSFIECPSAKNAEKSEF